MWTLVIFAIGVGPNPSTAIGKIEGFRTNTERFKQAEAVENQGCLLNVLGAIAKLK